MAEPVRVLLADDFPLVREGISAIIQRESDLALVGEAADGNEAMALCERLQPDVLLLDLSMPGPPPLTVVETLRARCPATRVLVLSGYRDLVPPPALLAAGVHGYVLKSEASAAIVQAVRTVAAGGTWFSQAIAEALLLPAEADAPAGDPPRLTPRQREVLQLLVRGATDQEIATALHLSPRTIQRHVRHIAAALGASNRTEAAALAVQYGLATPESGATTPPADV